MAQFDHQAKYSPRTNLWFGCQNATHYKEVLRKVFGIKNPQPRAGDDYTVFESNEQYELGFDPEEGIVFYGDREAILKKLRDCKSVERIVPEGRSDIGIRFNFEE